MKQVLITGASGGLGYGLVQSLCENGHRVWAAVRKPESMKDLQSKYSSLLTVVKIDMTNSSDVDQAFAEIQSKLDSTKEFVLVNNAGIAVGSPVESLAIEEWRNLYEINLFGPIRLIQKFLPTIRKTKGRIVNVGSISGRISSPFLAPYSSSKFALRSLTDSLRREVSPLGVKVVLIEPGPTKTNIWSRSLEHGQELETKMTDDMRAVYGKQVQSLRKGVEKTARDAIGVEAVVECMVDAIENENPKFYYLVGKNICLMALVARFMPTRILDKMLMSGFRGIKD
ncbi:short-chain dehydrogenase/reductase [Bdellovibrio sp. qaytius]|nr:short-chain dehydrogenase/reductase [Bdellovibrio sp. qaytius]